MAAIEDDRPAPELFEALVLDEMERSRDKNDPYHSEHEAIGVIDEELAELFDIVRAKPALRDPVEAVKELVQVASCCRCAVVELGFGTIGECRAGVASRLARRDRPVASLHEGYGRILAGVWRWKAHVLGQPLRPAIPPTSLDKEVGLDSLVSADAECAATCADLGLLQAAKERLKAGG